MSTATAESTLMQQQVRKSPNWWRVGDGVMLLLYAGVTLWTIRYHEKWADEAQAWLLARDLDLRSIWFHELRYEGSPGLWHTILWVAQHVFHAGYGTLGYIGVMFAVGGAAVLLFKAPFPRYVRWPLAFTYVMVYQYAVIARPYTILPLLAFTAAILFNDVQHPVRITVVLILLSLLTLHGAILAGCLGLAYLIEAWKSRSTLPTNTRNLYFICSGLLAATFLFIALILKPTPDVEEIALKNQIAQAPQAIQAQFPPAAVKLQAVLCGAFLDWFLPSVIFLLLLTAWCVWRRKWLAFVLPVGTLIGFYAAVHGAAHHHGTVFVAAITGLWISWPDQRQNHICGDRELLGLRAVTALLLVLCALNIWDATVVIKHEYSFPYSGAQDAANYLKRMGADRGPMFGLLFGVVAVQAYFDHNIFANNPTSYFHHGLPLSTTVLNVDELYRIKPQYVVAYSIEPELMLKTGVGQLTSRGYELVHFSDGYYLYKQGVFEREVYFIFRRLPDTSRVAPGAGDLSSN